MELNVMTINAKNLHFNEGNHKIDHFYTLMTINWDNLDNQSGFFYLPPVFENGGRYCFGVRRRLRRLRRLRGCFALYLGCY